MNPKDIQQPEGKKKNETRRVREIRNPTTMLVGETQRR
jgi:hypothetical protein